MAKGTSAAIEAGEPALVAEPANCLGVTSKGAMQLRGTGALALGTEKLLFDYWVIDRKIAIPRRALRRVEHVRSHLGKSVGSKLLKVFFVNEAHQYDSVAFRVTDLDAWTKAIEEACEENAARVGRPATEASPLAKTASGRALRQPRWLGLSNSHSIFSWLMVSTIAFAFPGIGPVIGGVSLLAGVVGLVAAWRARRSFAKLVAKNGLAYTAGPEGLFLDGQLVLEPWSVRSGHVIPLPGHGAEVRLDRGALRPDVVLRVDSLDEGRALLAALGVGAGDQAMTRKVTSRWLTAKGYFAALAPLLMGAPIAGALAAASLVPEQVFALAFVFGIGWLFTSFFTLGLIKTRITVGADGVSVRWLGRERVIPLAEIERVEAVPGFLGGPEIRLHLRSEETVKIAVAVRGNNLFEPFDAAAETALIVERIRDARRLGASVQEATIDAWMERQGGMATADFIRELRLHVRAAMKERGAEMLQGLLQVMEHATTPPALRATAAVALGPLLDETSRARLRAAAEASAQPRLRVALEAAADDRDADLAEAFAELTDEHRARVRVEVDQDLMAEAEQEVEELLAEAPREGTPYRERGGR